METSVSKASTSLDNSLDEFESSSQSVGKERRNGGRKQVSTVGSREITTRSGRTVKPSAVMRDRESSKEGETPVKRKSRSVS